MDWKGVFMEIQYEINDDDEEESFETTLVAIGLLV